MRRFALVYYNGVGDVLQALALVQSDGQPTAHDVMAHMPSGAASCHVIGKQFSDKEPAVYLYELAR